MTDTNYNTPISRATVEQQIEDLISLLDFLDGDPDLEPSLGWQVDYLGYFPQDPSNGYDTGDDREDDCEDEGADHDGREPEDYR
jgi:hypothetical protein